MSLEQPKLAQGKHWPLLFPSFKNCPWIHMVSLLLYLLPQENLLFR
ncbi:UNVERIFIED_CONTAM: hypothetical protein GTU68_017346 [Idotea baltica]|nr:hypothetical protein [Idotea baltica]MCL4149806.1 hypothetical protein [Idotea baltica]